MTLHDGTRPSARLASALACAQAWLVEPPPGPPRLRVVEAPPRPVVAVRGLAPGCGASTVARALAATLAAGDPRGAAVAAGDPTGTIVRLPTTAAGRLAREVAALGCDGCRAVGRLCLVPAEEPLAPIAGRRPSPLVIEIAVSSPPADGLGLADHVVLVAHAESDPAVASAIEGSLTRAGHSVDVVVNRFEEGGSPPVPDGAVMVPESRLAAQLALACRGARGAFAAPLAELAARARARATA